MQGEGAICQRYGLVPASANLHDLLATADKHEPEPVVVPVARDIPVGIADEAEVLAGQVLLDPGHVERPCGVGGGPGIAELAAWGGVPTGQPPQPGRTAEGGHGASAAGSGYRPSTASKKAFPAPSAVRIRWSSWSSFRPCSRSVEASATRWTIPSSRTLANAFGQTRRPFHSLQNSSTSVSRSIEISRFQVPRTCRISSSSPYR